jgi:hypothetical protein
MSSNSSISTPANAVAGDELSIFNKRFWVAALVLFLVPFSTSIEESGVSANYSFLILLAFLRPFHQWPTITKIFVSYAIICYVWSVWIVSPFPEGEFYWRQLASALVFTLPLLVMATQLPFDIHLLTRIVVLCATLYSAATIFIIICILPDNTPFVDLKYLLGAYLPDWPQRYILILMLSFFLALRLAQRHIAWILPAALCGMVIVCTNIRAGLATIALTLTLLAVCYLAKRNWRGLRIIIILLLSGVLLLEMSTNSPFVSTLFHADRTLASYHQLQEGGESMTSENIRLHIWGSISTLMIEKKMWIGSGFAGPYLFFPEIGSTHNQYLDVLLRTGPIGLALYLSLWGLLLWRSFRYAPELGVAMLSWLIFGLVHESTKFSYGAFIFFSLLCLSQYGWERRHTPPQPTPAP